MFFFFITDNSWWDVWRNNWRSTFEATFAVVEKLCSIFVFHRFCIANLTKPSLGGLGGLWIYVKEIVRNIFYTEYALRSIFISYNSMSKPNPIPITNNFYYSLVSMIINIYLWYKNIFWIPTDIFYSQFFSQSEAGSAAIFSIMTKLEMAKRPH